MKVCIITNGNFFARVELTRLFQERNRDIVGVIVVTGIKANKSRFRSLVEVWKNSGWRYFLYKLSTYMVFAAAGLIYPRGVFFVPGLAKDFSIPVVYTAQVNAREVVNQVKEWRPDVLISVSCPQRIRRPLLSIPTNSVINIHASMLPKYAGIAPYVWALANGEVVTGTTVHVMEESFDTGDIIAQRHLTIKKNETTFSLFLRLCILGSDVLAEAVTDLMKGTVSLTPQDLKLYTYFSWPGRDTIRALFRNGHRLFSLYDVVEAIRYVK